MKKTIYKIVLILLVILSAILVTTVSASSVIGDIEGHLKDNTSVKQSVINTSNTVLGVIKVAGTGIAIVMLLYIAIKYMMASPDAKASYKKTAIANVVGAVVLFAAPRLVELVMKISQNLTGKL